MYINTVLKQHTLTPKYAYFLKSRCKLDYCKSYVHFTSFTKICKKSYLWKKVSHNFNIIALILQSVSVECVEWCSLPQTLMQAIKS